MVFPDFSELAPSGSSQRSLLRSWQRSRGRSHGKITVRHKGGGVKKLYRVLDFLQDKFEIPGVVIQIEYDPYRTARIALVKYADGDKRYILAPEGVKQDDRVISSEKKIAMKVGHRMPLRHITVGTFVHNIELTRGKGGALARSAGAYAKVLAQEGKYTHLGLASSEVRKVINGNLATVGVVSHSAHSEEVIGKAGRSRHKGIRPTVRGSAMNPVDHPHGGGEGHAPIGLKYPKTKWGKPARGVRTRNRKKYSRTFVMERRKRNK
jgi:large subunit ribosomal protein L2